jgi:hypothetical protein
MVASPRSKPNPKDFTGNRKRILAEQHREELLEKQAQLSMRTQVMQENLDTPIDVLTGLPVEGAASAPVDGDDDVATPVYVAPEFATIRVACDLEKVTIGQGKVYEFREGQVYRVPYNVAVHLWNLGYVWQWL